MPRQQSTLSGRVMIRSLCYHGDKRLNHGVVQAAECNGQPCEKQGLVLTAGWDPLFFKRISAKYGILW